MLLNIKSACGGRFLVWIHGDDRRYQLRVKETYSFRHTTFKTMF